MVARKRHLRAMLEKAYSVYLLTDSNPTFGNSEAALRLIHALEVAKTQVLKSMGPLPMEDHSQLVMAYAFYQGDILGRW